MKLNMKADIKKEKKRIKNSFKYAIEGIFAAFKSERNMKIHIFAMLLVIVCGLVFQISGIEWAICLILFAGVIAMEIINTSIETIVDMVMPNYNSKAKIAKDTAAGAVLVWAVFSAIIGLIIFIPKIIELF